MSLTHQVMRCMGWSGVLCLALSTGCKKSSESEKAPPEGPATAEQKPEAPAGEGAKPATPSTEPGTAVVEEQVTPPVTDAIARAIVEEGRAVAKDIDATIAAIDANKLDEAKTNLNKASDDLAKLSAHLPAVDVAVELWREDKQLDVAEIAGTVDTVPLLATLTRVDVPVYDRKQVEARHAQRKGQSPSSVSAEDKRGDLRVVDSNLVYLEVDMPVIATKLAVEDAKRRLDAGEADSAKAALQRAVASFDVVEVVTKAPEYQARLQVWAAEKAFAKGNTGEASKLLDEASDLLAPLAKDDEDPESKAMVQTLLAEIKPLKDALGSGATDQDQGFRRLTRDVSSYTRRMALRALMDVHQRAEQRELADALMWLEKADTEGLTTAERNAAASADLEHALSVLAKAKAHAPPSAAGNFDDLYKRVEAIMQLDSAAERDALAIESRLRDVIFDLRMLMLEVGISPVSSKQGPA